jgi:hypothetical protein
VSLLCISAAQQLSDLPSRSWRSSGVSTSSRALEDMVLRASGKGHRLERACPGRRRLCAGRAGADSRLRPPAARLTSLPDRRPDPSLLLSPSCCSALFPMSAHVLRSSRLLVGSGPSAVAGSSSAAALVRAFSASPASLLPPKKAAPARPSERPLTEDRGHQALAELTTAVPD